MKDLFSKITFGFVMAQLVPGAIAVASVSFLYTAMEMETPTSMRAVAVSMEQAFSGAVRQLVLLVASVGAGMLIHGVQWAVVGHLETRFRSIFDSYWHDLPVGVQILLGPVKAVREVVELLVLTKHIRDAGVNENVSEIDESKMDQFEFIQDFYLHFGQFYAHSAYALLASIGSLTFFTLTYGFTWRRVLCIGALYLACGVCFIVGRIQFQSMFRAEQTLAGTLNTET